MIFIIKVTTNKEERAVEMITDRVTAKDIPVYTVSPPHGIRGYIILEAENRDAAERAVFNLPYVKGIVGKTVPYEEIESLIKPSVKQVTVEEGDIVEIISKPFSKEKAKVERVDKQKGEVVVNLLGAVVPLPVTVKLDNVKVVQRKDDEDSEGGQE
ncbi:MAG: transcription elongation factor Spt5 [Candidatus Pacearchaeota archaeon]